MANDETTTEGTETETETKETIEAAEASESEIWDHNGVRLGTDWTPFYELRDAIETLHALAWQRWHPQNPETKVLPIAKDVRDALQDLRPIVDEARGLWKWLARYEPNAPKPPAGRLQIPS